MPILLQLYHKKTVRDGSLRIGGTMNLVIVQQLTASVVGTDDKFKQVRNSTKENWTRFSGCGWLFQPFWMETKLRHLLIVWKLKVKK